MKKIVALLLLSAIYIVTAAGQDSQQVDSLLKALDKASSDSVRMTIYRRLGNYYTDNNAGKAIGYLENSLLLANKLKRPLMVANDHYNIAFCYLLKSDFKASLDNYLQSVRLYEQLKDTFRLTNAFMSIGNLFSQQKNLPKTLEYYDKAEALIVFKKDTAQLSNIMGQRGTLYDQQRQYDQALQYLHEALRLARTTGDAYLVTNNYSNIGLTYKHKRNTTLALRYFDSALALYATMDVPVDNFAAIYNNIAATHSQAGNYALAKKAFDKSIGYAQQAGSPYIVMENYSNLADMYGHMQEHGLENNYLKKYYAIRDSLFTADNKNQLTALEADYQIEKRNAALVKKDAEVSRQQQQRNIFIIIALATILLLGALFFLYSRIKKSNRLLREKNELIHRQNRELENLNQVKDRLFGIISHDLRNPLVTLRTYLSLADDIALPPEKKQFFKKATMQAVTQTCDMLDNLLVWANLQIKQAPPAITPIDLEECVWDVVNTVQSQAAEKEITISHQVNIQQALGDETIISIAIRNILTNAIKFSAAGSTVHVYTERGSDGVLLSIRDEGIGMSPEQVEQLYSNSTGSTLGTQEEKGSGLGIFLVRELLQKINGSLLIHSEVNKGSCFIIQLPTA